MHLPPSTARVDLRQNRRASALLAVYWVIAILSMALFTGAQFLLVELETQGNTSLEFRAEQLADAGVALAMHPKMERWDPLLRQRTGPTEGFEASIISEGARLNPNVLAISEGGRRVLTDLFMEFGLSEFDSQSLSAAMADWVDRDSDETPLGAEGEYYRSKGWRGIPFNRPFRDLEEMVYVRGFDEVAVRYPGWRDVFTLWSAGKLDLNDAPAELISLVCACPPGNASRFVKVRAGRDGIAGTEDDVKFESVSQALDVLGLQGEVKQLVENLVSVDDATARLISVGKIGDILIERTVVVRDRNENPSFVEVRTRRLR
ncbi:MAG: general secretion pathway protein GspK [Verrucomicrobiae bacterium]|nr:general secretion pathway protein GspK [Verrucomicrobiae bacterium]